MPNYKVLKYQWGEPFVRLAFKDSNNLNIERLNISYTLSLIQAILACEVPCKCRMMQIPRKKIALTKNNKMCHHQIVFANKLNWIEMGSIIQRSLAHNLINLKKSKTKTTTQIDKINISWVDWINLNISNRIEEKRNTNCITRIYSRWTLLIVGDFFSIRYFVDLFETIWSESQIA